ncbi:hypothetical protein [Clostridium sp.]|uniref:hypothetical protein n=1 Tax=Clostridium sp. TaxID=1506 RepID=UPI00290FF50C|nr:hypothetical protein [Clostridium sp.]MDU5105248.1 hypothetical protein [Clostridium sp.]
MNDYSYKTYNPTEIELNIIIGSLLGDGSLALYGRSKNAYYREHGCYKQIPYRIWKYKNLKSLDFTINTNYKYAKLYSHSNNFFTDLYNKFYINKTKTITEDNIKLLTHPIGLATFYMDDGSLVIDSVKRKNNDIYIFPRIALYTLSFSEKENIIIKNHLENTFDVKTKLKYRKDGKKTIIEINKKEDIIKFINVVKPYVSEISCMMYKIDLQGRFEEKKSKLINLGYKNINSWNIKINNNYYSKEDESFIKISKESGMSTKEIAKILNRPYWGIVDKIRRMNK